MNQKRNRGLVSPARRAAFDILDRVESESAYASVLIAQLSESGLSREDRALTQELVLGVLRWRGLLDYLIERYAKRPIARFDLKVLIALRMGLYQLRYLSRIPQSAAVNESVNLVKRARATSAAGLANAVLRSAARSIDQRAGEELTDPVERASIELSHPVWMLERWRGLRGDDETHALALANNSPATQTFRVNTIRFTVADALEQLAAEGVTTRESELAPGAFVVESGPGSSVARAAERGLIYIQDQASQLVSLLLDAKPGHRVLDLCAAPGSKSSHIAALTENTVHIVSCDVHPHRLGTLRAMCRRLGVTSIDAVALDAARALPFAESSIKFDRVLVDAPCSGTGTLRGNPEIKWRLTLEDIENLAKLQLSLLQNASAAVAVGGRLLYSTCSLEREENEAVIREFLDGDAPFRVIEPDVRGDLLTDDGFVRTFPHRHGSDGFFAAVLEKIAR
jgi:16S rRNA (cytosine967-C5)-methyltransferase